MGDTCTGVVRENFAVISCIAENLGGGGNLCEYHIWRKKLQQIEAQVVALIRCLLQAIETDYRIAENFGWGKVQ